MKTRFAPSPTGPFHIGGLRTALLVQALAQSKEGEALLRIEDTDLQRSTKAYEKEIFDSLSWAGIPFDGPYPHQSDRLALYDDIIQELLDKKLAYYCYMTADELNDLREGIRAHNKQNPNDYRAEKYDNRYRPDFWPNGVPDDVKASNPKPVVRLIMDNNGTTQWKDGAKGLISIENDKLDDLIIRRSDGSPTYNFVVVVDDMDMNVTDVIRGDDHINNTPKQLTIHKILKNLPRFANAPYINYTHLPLMLNPDGSKISKSALALPDYEEKVKNNEVVPATLSDYKKMGILPKALVNYLLQISSQKTAQKFQNGIFEMDDFVKVFKSKDLSISAARFDLKKLLNINFHYINAMDNDTFKQIVSTFDPATPFDKIQFDAVATEVKKRSKTLTDCVKFVNELVTLKKTIFENYNSMTPFARSGLMARTEDEFKNILQQQAENDGKTFGEISKQFREESKLNTVLPFFPVIKAIQTIPAPTLAKKVRP